MSGTIHIVNNKSVNKLQILVFIIHQFLPKKHNHVEIIFEILRLFIMIQEDLVFFNLLKIILI